MLWHCRGTRAPDTLSSMAQPLVVWDQQMLRYDLGGSHPLHPLRWELTWKLAGALGVLDGIELTSPQPASDDELAEIHTRDYIAAVRRSSGPEPSDWHVGHGIGTSDNPAFPGMHEASALIAGGSLAGGQGDRRRLGRPGGQHRRRAAPRDGRPGVGVLRLQRCRPWPSRSCWHGGVERVAYVDVDVHHGDGVQAAFYDDPRVLTVSVHETPLTLWPGTGFPTECGRGAAVGTAVNVPVPAGTGDAAWLRAFHAVVPSVVTAFRPQVLVTQHGADSHRDDPLADLNLTVDGQLAAYRALRDLAESAADGRWLALGGGGYALVTGGAAGLDAPAGHGPRPGRRSGHDHSGGLAGRRRGGPPRRRTAAHDDRRHRGAAAVRPVGRPRRGPGRPLDHRGAACGLPVLRARSLRPP